MTNKLSADVMDDILEQLIGQNYWRSHDDERGCSMNRNGYWLSPKSVVDAVRLALGEFGIELEEPVDPDAGADEFDEEDLNDNDEE